MSPSMQYFMPKNTIGHGGLVMEPPIEQTNSKDDERSKQTEHERGDRIVGV